jgi:endonuclease-3
MRERAEFIDRELANLYPNPPIPLDHTNSYTLLIAVLLSAQCTDARVNKITPDLFKLASDPLNMTKLSVDQINSVVRPCGLAPRKAKAIHGLSLILLTNIPGKYHKPSKNWKNFLGWVTKQLP